MKKKGSINLSINMIIVLIIGIVILGLALGFVRGMFSNLEREFEMKLEAEPDPAIPRSSMPVTVSSENKILDVKASGAYKINIFNPTPDDWKVVKPVITCGTGNSPTVFSDASGYGDVQVYNESIASGQYESFDYLFFAPDAMGPGQYLCKVVATYKFGSTIVGVGDSEYDEKITIKIQG